MNQKQRARDLIELAVDDRTPEKERLAAAVKAVTLIRQHDLLASPFDGLSESGSETVRAATKIVEKLTDPDLISSARKMMDEVRRVGATNAVRRRKRA